MRRFMLIDPQVDGEPMFIDFYSASFELINGDEIVCFLNEKQVSDINFYDSRKEKIAVQQDVIDYLKENNIIGPVEKATKRLG